MMRRRSLCFIMMPFQPELNYFFLYLKHHIEANHPLRVERGDTRILTRPLMHKIVEQVDEARLAIADITGGNPNVLYEVGLAHAQSKPVIFLTQDNPEEAPVDLSGFEYIRYDLSDSVGFLHDLDRALEAELSDQFAELYEDACQLHTRFAQDTGHDVPVASEEEFYKRVNRAVRSKELPPVDAGAEYAEFLLPKIVQESTDIATMKRLTDWLSSQFG